MVVISYYIVDFFFVFLNIFIFNISLISPITRKLLHMESFGEFYISSYIYI